MKLITGLVPLVCYALIAPGGAAAALPDYVVDGDPGGPEDTEEENEDTDYWKGIDFTKNDFAEVRSVVKLFYIDPGFDKRLAWVTAADYVLRTMTPARRLVPEEHLKSMKKEVEPLKLAKKDPFVIVDKADQDQLDFRSMSDDEIRKKKESIRAKTAERDKAWSRIAFTEKDFERVVDFVRENESKKPDFSESKLYIAAATGYLASLDPHTTVISAKAWAEATKDTVDNSFEGIGAMLTVRGEDIIIETPVESQPAEKAGLRAGDQIMSVDGREVSGMPLPKVVKMIKGRKGTTVVLKIRRQGMPGDMEFRIVREHIDVRNVQSRMLKGHPDIGYLKITGFVEGTSAQVETAIRELLESSKGGRLRGLVLDLRMNSGGLLQESVEIADAFLDEGVIVSVKSPSERDETYKAQPGKWDFPVVVLVNSGSASASEILASAIQENGRGLVVGDRTFGKASVQTLMPPYLRKDYFIKVTIARYYAPSGRTIQVTGVTPDIDVPPEFGGKQPLGFREEDLAHHLTRIKADYRSPNVELVRELKKCTDRMGMADPMSRADPHPVIKADYQLMVAGDYLECIWAKKSRSRPLQIEHAETADNPENRDHADGPDPAVNE